MSAQRPPARDRDYDLVVFGATGFTGRLTAEYLARNLPSDARWALAGRDRSRLEAVRAGLAAGNECWQTLPLLHAEVGDRASLERAARSARVVVTTVGPYALYGEPLVAACATAGTDYVDLTGEPEFVDSMWLRYHDTAAASGARLVHCCGFDSIPHDLGVYFTVQQLPEHLPLRVRGYVAVGGEFSGGTYHSAINAFARLRQAARVAAERRAREPKPVGRTVRGERGGIRYQRELASWVLPMPTIDPQVVLRSARLLDRYGPDFRYGHYLRVKHLSTAAAIVGGVGAAVALAQFAPTRRWLLGRKAPGEGPSAERRAQGWFSVRLHGEAEGGPRVVGEVRGGDPGYGETSKMLAESAMCLAFDELPRRAGQLTPAAAMGEALLARLQHAGIQFKLVERG